MRKHASSKRMLQGLGGGALRRSQEEEEAARTAAELGTGGELRAGDRAWYREQDGTRTEGVIVSIDYGVQVWGCRGRAASDE